MSEHDLPAQSASGADGQSSPAELRKRRNADATIKDQDAVRDYLTFKQTKGLMTDSEKRLLDKIAAVCGMSIGSLQQDTASTDNLTRKS